MDEQDKGQDLVPCGQNHWVWSGKLYEEVGEGKGFLCAALKLVLGAQSSAMCKTPLFHLAQLEDFKGPLFSCGEKYFE